MVHITGILRAAGARAEGDPPAGGVKPMPIATRLVSERERLHGMTDEERAWRKQWLKDQELSHHEPKTPKGYYEARYNPIRRFYRAPLEKLQEMLIPSVGESAAIKIRYITGKALLGIAGIYAITYYFKYNSNDWTRKGSWRVYHNRPRILPNHPDFPKVSDRTKPSDYANRGFNNSPI